MAGTMFENWPPQLVQAFIILVVGALGTLGLVLTALGLYIRSSLKTSASKHATDLAITKTSFEFVATEAKRLSERQERMDDMIVVLREDKAAAVTRNENFVAQVAELNRQLELARATNRERDQQARERDQQRDQQIGGLIATKETDNKRIEELTKRTDDLHGIKNELAVQLQAAGIKQLQTEKERDDERKERIAAQAALKTANELNADLSTRLGEAESKIIVLQTQVDDLIARVPVKANVPTENVA
jgi:hypothetical protein